MKAVTKKRTAVFVSAVVLIVAVICGVLVWMNRPKPRLTEAQVAELRSQYPICGQGAALASTRKVTLEESAEFTETFVYGEITGDAQYGSRNISTGYEDWDKKLEDNGLGTMEYREHTMRIISDTKGIFQKGDVIRLNEISVLYGYYPELTDGMQVVMPVIRERTEGVCSYAVQGTYYITEDGYAISAYDEGKLSKTVYSGIQTDALMKELAKLEQRGWEYYEEKGIHREK